MLHYVAQEEEEEEEEGKNLEIAPNVECQKPSDRNGEVKVRAFASHA